MVREVGKNKLSVYSKEKKKNSPAMLFALEWIRLRCVHFAIGDSVYVGPPTASLSSNNLCSNCKGKINTNQTKLQMNDFSLADETNVLFYSTFRCLLTQYRAQRAAPLNLYSAQNATCYAIK